MSANDTPFLRVKVPLPELGLEVGDGLAVEDDGTVILLRTFARARAAVVLDAVGYRAQSATVRTPVTSNNPLIRLGTGRAGEA